MEAAHSAEGISDLKALLASLMPTLDPEPYVYTTLPCSSSLPEGLNPFAVVRETEATTLIVLRSSADQHLLAYNRVYRKITLKVHSSLQAVGLTATVATELKNNNIPANVISGFYHDNIFVSEEFANLAMSALTGLQKRNKEEVRRPTKIYIIFGRPGAGKDAVGEQVLKRLKDLVQLDLDNLRSEKMKADLNEGIWPSSEERTEFALRAVEFVKNETESRLLRRALITFSFVNTDMREIFRETFGDQLQWFLLNTDEEIARQRIKERTGHFYTNWEGEWKFEDVDFHHHVIPLDGTASTETNGRIVALNIDSSS